jgi:cellulose synthase/poly-beta-1,6-N-acetylglucosamine synthase-like glycosyltransferase
MDKATSGSANLTLPRVAVFIPCYMPNEAGIIMETLRIMTEAEYDGELDFFVVYNTRCEADANASTPVELEIERELAKLERMNGRRIVCRRVATSMSKADNLEYAVSNYAKEGEICVLFDADHHPRSNTIRGLVSVLMQMPDAVAVQGSVLIERGGPWWMRRFLDGMEWASWCFYAPGFAELVGSSYFGCGNAAWRVETLREMGFDRSMLTEDIDISVRTLAAGYTMVLAPFLQVGEMCPTGLGALYRQRLRWAMGWEQVTLNRTSTLFSSQRISEPRKFRTMMLLLFRYVTFTMSGIAIFNVLKQVCERDCYRHCCTRRSVAHSTAAFIELPHSLPSSRALSARLMHTLCPPSFRVPPSECPLHAHPNSFSSISTCRRPLTMHRGSAPSRRRSSS